MTFKAGDVTLTRDGTTARILCTDALPPRSVIALLGKHQDSVWRYLPNGSLNETGTHPLDLRPVHQNPDPRGFRMDQPLLVRDHASEPWIAGHYSPSEPSGAGPSQRPDFVAVWNSGKTSWTTRVSVRYKQWKLPDAQS